MSKLDQKYIENLQKFSDALENIVELLKEQTKKGGDGGSTDAVNTMLNGIDTQKITKIVEDLDSINNRTKKIESNTDKILAEIRDTKKAKESGMFDKIEDPKNKNKIVDGIKSVALIAGAILAMGIAFKIVGDVDIMSVLAISASIFIMAKTFSDISNLKNLNYSKMLMVGMTIGALSIALLLSALILKLVPTFSMMQLVSIGLIGFTIGVAAYGILSGISKLTPRQLGLALLTPTILPAIALGLLLSSVILKGVQEISVAQLLSIIGLSIAFIPMSIAVALVAKNIKDLNNEQLIFAALAIPTMALAILGSSYLFSIMQTVSFGSIFSAILIGIALIPISFAFAMILYGLKKGGVNDEKPLIFAAAAIPIMALVLVVASMILQKMQPLDDIGSIILTSLAIGLSVLFLTPAFILLSKVNLKPKEMLFGALGILIISTVIMAASWILSVGNYGNYPNVGWAAGVGLSLIAFALPMIGLGILLFATMGIGFAILGLGAVGILIVATTIVATSYILGVGNYDKYPNLEWASGVGLALLSFAAPMVLLGALFPLLVLGLAGLLLVVGAVLATSYILSNGDYNGYPPMSWVKGAGGALLLFSEIVNSISLASALTARRKVKSIGNSIVDLAEILNENQELFNNLDVAWLNSIKMMLSVFSDMPDYDKTKSLNQLSKDLLKLMLISKMNVSPIVKLAIAIRELSNSMNELNTEGVDKLMKLSGGVMVLSLVDSSKLEDVIELLEDKQKDLARIFDEKSSPFMASLMNSNANMGANVTSINNIPKTEKSKFDILLEEQLKVQKQMNDKLDEISSKMERIDIANKVGNV